MYVNDIFPDPSPAQVRGRPKYSAYQNFKGRKSSSMMNLYGKTFHTFQLVAGILIQSASCLELWGMAVLTPLLFYALLG